ncbi:MAG TPA: FadR family transcriptional regulator [Candidatus Pelethocola excrementipullorum]|nr:FadR family transcriptional regulator [Candidatus Pelethocola excrementipullorum]
MSKLNTSDQVLGVIREKIISKEWQAGMKITGEVQLAQELGVSRASVRGAMEQMVAMGLLTRRRGDGTYVNDVSTGTLFQDLFPDMMLSGYSALEIIDFREIIEPECVKRFIRNYDEEQVQKLITCCDIMEVSAERNSTKFADADLDFHLIIVEGCKNPVMIKVMSIVREILEYYQYSANELIGPQTGVKEHRRIIEAISEKDEELAALLMRRHIQRSKRDIKELLTSKG